MKKLYTTFALALLAVLVFAQTPNISMTTTLGINSQISFTIRGNSGSTPIQIDWGNGVKQNYTIGDMDEAFGFPVKGSTIKIWGQGVEGLNIQSKELTAMEFYQATSLKTLFCKGNKLTTLNLTDCPTLTLVECKQNQITSLTLPSTTTLTYVDCSDNNLTLASLPLKQGTWTTYIYSPQKDYALAKTVYALNEEIDLSSQLNINGNTTTYTWKTAGGTTLVNGVDYNVAGGKFTFLKTYSESIYCEMSNSTFPSLTLKTINISIPTIPTVVMTTTKEIGNTFSLGISAIADNTSIKVDWGNGILVDYTINAIEASISGTLSGNIIKIYGVGIMGLNVQYKNITELEISKATSLKYLYCALNEISNLDISKNTALIILNCHNNKLAAIDISKNTELEIITCDNNQLCSLDLSQNNNLVIVYCSSNKLTFSTLPIRKPTWTAYEYSPQAALKLSKNKYSINEEIDLSSQLSINGSTTQYTWKTKAGVTLMAGTDYTESNGKFSFLQGNSDSIYCEMKNSNFADLTLSTNALCLALPNSPILTMTTTANIGSSFSFIIRSITDNNTVYVDWGNDVITYHNIISSNSVISGTLKTNTIKLYGSGIFYIDVMSKSLTDVNVSNNSDLKYFFCKGNKLSTIDVTKNTSLIRLNICDNFISNIDITKNTSLVYLDCYNNQLSAIDVSKNNALISLDCYSNQLTFHTLPIKLQSWTTYNYSPQAKIKIDKKQYNLSETVDLSSDLTINNNSTSYIWKTKGGATLTSGTNYRVTGGITTFLKPQTDSIYCQMTNATFPLLTLNTTNIKVSVPTSIDSEFEQVTKVYPNPVSNLLWVASEEAIKKVEIYTVLGAKVFEQDYNNAQEVNINFAVFPKGLLIIKVHGANGVMEKKILKE